MSIGSERGGEVVRAIRPGPWPSVARAQSHPDRAAAAIPSPWDSLGLLRGSLSQALGGFSAEIVALSPVAGTALTSTQSLSFDLLWSSQDPDVAPVIVVSYPDAREAELWTPEVALALKSPPEFAGHYAHPRSTATAISGGHRITLYRAGGWPGPPRVEVVGVKGAAP